ncbi:gamma-glutamyltransferase 1 [Hypoxylon crocopeplum]|nr:gamma-glutamyltransferase 1 [Hypoxylon crocopeplum]
MRLRRPRAYHHRGRVEIIMLFASVFGVALTFFYFISSALPNLWAGNRTTLPLPAGTVSSDGRLGAVASVSKTCSKVGTDIIKSGGNAIDAAVAAQFCLGVVAPNLTGLGGGGFALVRSRNGSYDFVDFREAAPAASSEDMFEKNPNSSLEGGLASGIPGEIRGLEYLHTTYGSLPWSHLLQPAIQLARFGHVVTKDLDVAMDTYAASGFLVQDPSWAVDFAPNGTRLHEGDLLTRKRYGELLQSIANDGPDAFYTGKSAAAIVQALKATGGIMTTTDLKEYSVTIREPLSVDYRGFKIISGGAPSSGAVVLQVMKTVEGYPDFGKLDAIDLNTHRLDEAIRFGYGARTLFGDPSFVGNVTTFEHGMLRNSTIVKIRGRISDSHTLPVSDYNPLGLESIETPGTSHLSVADGGGMAIALTSTINLDFGSKIMVPETGLIMNNEMDDFSSPNSTNSFGYIPSPENFIRPGKRPQSSMAPAIVEFLSNRTLYFVVGADGGSRIITAVIQALWHVLDHNMTTLEALGAPRFHDQLVPDQMSFQPSYSNETIRYLQARGHNITWEDNGQSDAHALRRLSGGVFEAAADPRLKNSGGLTV